MASRQPWTVTCPSSTFQRTSRAVSRYVICTSQLSTAAASNRDGVSDRAAAVFWGTTLIDAVVLRDGRLQGFSHVTRRCQCPALRAAEARASRNASAGRSTQARSASCARGRLHEESNGGNSWSHAAASIVQPGDADSRRREPVDEPVAARLCDGRGHCMPARGVERARARDAATSAKSPLVL